MSLQAIDLKKETGSYFLPDSKDNLRNSVRSFKSAQRAIREFSQSHPNFLFHLEYDAVKGGTLIRWDKVKNVNRANARGAENPGLRSELDS